MKSLPFHGIILLEKSENLQVMDGTVHVAICAIAAEAFLQDIKSHYQAISQLRSYTQPPTIFRMNPEPIYFGGGAVINGQMEYLSSSEKSLEKLIDALEKESLIKKYEEVLKFLNSSWSKGSDEAFKNLKRLITLRNKLVHIKSDEIELDEDNLISEHPRVIYELLRLGVLANIKPATSWIYILDNENLVNWARNTVINIMKKILETTPNSPISNNFKLDYLSDLKTLKFK